MRTWKNGPLAEAVAQQIGLGRDDLVGLALVLGQLADEAEDARDVFAGRAPEVQHAAAILRGSGVARGAG